MPASAPDQPWPQQTEAPQASSSHERRQIVTDQSEVALAKQQCEVDSGNEVVSCFPTADVIIPQHQWATFVWNSQNPDFTQTDRVDIYLFHGDSLEEIFVMKNRTNPRGQAGSVTSQVNDTWWGERGANWAGQNISYPFYWLIARAGESLDDGTLTAQTTFSAVQTTFADSVLSSMQSASVSASLASVSRADASTTPAPSVTTSPGPKGGIQATSGGSTFPHYAIVIIVIGIVAVGLICAAMLCAIFYLRREDRRRGRRVRSRSPSMSQAAATAGIAAPVPVPAAVTRDATVLSHQQSPSPPADTTAKPFSSADALIMANAFRTELRARDGADGGSGSVRESDDEGEDEEPIGSIGRTSTSRPGGWRESVSSGGAHSYQAVGRG